MNTTIRSWDDVNRSLADLGGLHRDLKTFTVERDEAIERAKDTYSRKATPVESQIAAVEESLERFVTAHQADLDGRSKELHHGRVGLLLVADIFRIASKNVKSAIAWLLAAKKLDYLHVEHKLNKETLREAPDTVLRAIKAKVVSEDRCWYEVDGERHAVES